jgi:molybdenum cofactor synthesis domain-containing protein
MDGSSWILAIGDELLSGHTVDTNSNWLAQRLRQTPYPVRRMVVLGDLEDDIVEAVAAASAGGASRVFCCGGLGPTPDDRTVAALARAFEVPLQEDQQTLERIRHRTARLFEEGRLCSPEPNPGNRKMALVPAGAVVLRNPAGSAPPLAIPLPSTAEPRWLLVVPGVPRELMATVEEEIIPVFCAGDSALVYGEHSFTGIAESQFFPLLTQLALEHPRVRFGSYPQARPGDVVIRACAPGGAELEEAMRELRERAPGPLLAS